MVGRLIILILFLAGAAGITAGLAASKRDQTAEPATPPPNEDPSACRAMLDDPSTGQLQDWVDAHRTEIAALITPDHRQRFDDLLRTGHCEGAEAMIREGYRATFAHMQCFFEPTARNPFAWRIHIAAGVYPALGLCFGEQALSTAIAAFRKRGLTPPVAQPARGPDELERAFGDLWTLVLDFDVAVMRISDTCRFGRYQPGCLALARLADRGILELADDEILFLVVRARLAGHDPPDRALLEADITARLDDETVARAETRARESLAEWGIATVDE